MLGVLLGTRFGNQIRLVMDTQRQTPESRHTYPKESQTHKIIFERFPFTKLETVPEENEKHR
jgi:hypothetical protein